MRFVKKSLCILAAGSFLISASSFALPLVDINLGVEVFQADTEVNDHSFSGHDHLIGGYVAIEHAIPLIPNARVDFREFNASGIDVDRYDATLYYQVLDNSLLSLDLGLGATRFELKDGDDGNEHSPHLYAAVEAGLPFVNWSVFADGRYTKHSDNDGTDLSAGVKWEKDRGMSPIGYGIRAGYRLQDHSFEHIQGDDLDIKHHGLFAAFDLRF